MQRRHFWLAALGLALFIFVIAGGIVGSYALTVVKMNEISRAEAIHRCGNVKLVYDNTPAGSKLHNAYGKVSKRDGCHL